MKKFQIIILLFFLVFFGFFLIGESKADELIYRSHDFIDCAPVDCFTRDVYVQGDYAYVANFNGSLFYIHNISNPDSITVAGTKETGSSGNISIFVQGNYAYLVNYYDDKLSIFDVSDPSSIVTKASTSANLADPRSVFVQGNYAYVVSEFSNNLAIFDVSNPDSIVAKDSTTTNLNSPKNVYIQGDYAYVASYGNFYLAIFDISNPDSIVAKGSTNAGLHKPRSVFVQGNYAYVTNLGNNRLAIFDISNPDSIVTKGFTSDGLDTPHFAHIQNDYAYVTNLGNNRLAIFDISNPDSIVSKCFDSTQLAWPLGLFVKEEYIYVASYSNHCLVIFEHPQAASPVPTVDIKADGADGPITIDYNASADLTWTSSDAVSCLASGDWSGAKPLSGSESTGALTASKTYTITCTGPGGSANDSVTVNVNPPLVPTVDIQADGTDGPITIDYNASADLTWTSSDAVSCLASGDWSGAKPLSGSESTGALTASKTYTITCTGPGGSANDSVTVNVNPPVIPTGDFNIFGWAWSDNFGWISFNYENCYPTGPPGCPPIIVAGYGVDIDDVTGDFSGYAWSDNIGWISFQPGDVAGCPVEDPVHGCLSWVDTGNGEVFGWARVVLDTGDPAKGWIRLSDRANGIAGDDAYINEETKEFHNYAWSDDYGWISFNCKEGGPGGADICGTLDYKVYTTLEFVTDVSNLSNSFDSPCVQSRIPTLSWETSDAPFDYELEIDGDTGTIQESGTIATTNGSWSPSCQKCCDVAPYNDITFPNKIYNWRVKVKIAAEPWSDWENSTFTTLANCYPDPDFTLEPENPAVSEEIQLCSVNDGVNCLVDESVCYGIGAPSCSGQGFLWDIPEIPANGSYLDGTTNTDENPKIQLDVISDTYIILEITDTGIVVGSGDCSDNRAGCCAIRNDVIPGLPLPEWEETSPKS